MPEYKGLYCQTAGDANPHDHSRVYICCHPDDYNEVNKRTANEILSIQTNVAIYYYDPSEGIPDNDEFFNDLLHMNLFVVAVTSNFIRHESEARNSELVFAVENSIPILPLMQEDIPSRDFSSICNGLQALNRYSLERDPTSIPYEERLKSFLQSVLVGENMTRRIRDSFDAQIFLSYRRSDRTLAQQLIRQIHSFALLRDVAIWYDEFLEIGEDYRPAIAEALKESDAFILAVTPRLLQEGNYVLTKEYPLALDSGIPILPIEIDQTDRIAFLSPKRYKLAGKPITANSPGDIEFELSMALQGSNLLAHAGDPSHDYLIGLAYLKGIYVEIDRNRALSLLESAAKKNNHEAFERIVTMYETGEGVKRDLNAAIKWQENYVTLLRKEVAEWPSPTVRRELVRVLGHLGQLQSDMQDYAGALETHQEQLGIAESLAWETITPEDRRLLINAFLRVGGIKLALNNPDEALTCYESALAIVKPLMAETRAKEDSRIESLAQEAYIVTKRSQAAALIGIGQSYFNQGEEQILSDGTKIFKSVAPERAMETYMNALSICESLVKESGNKSDYRLLSAALNAIGKASQALYDSNSALSAYERAAAVLEKLVVQDPSPRSKNDLADELVLIGRTKKDAGDASGALEAYEEALVISEKLAEKDSSAETLRTLASMLRRVGGARKEAGDALGALEAYRRVVKIRRGLADENPDADNDELLAYGLLSVGDALKNTGDTPNALEAYEEALAISEKLAEKDSSAETLRTLASMLSAVGNARKDVGDILGALEAYERAVVVRKRVRQETRFHFVSRDWGSTEELDWIGRTRLAMNDAKRALPAFEQEFTLREMQPHAADGDRHVQYRQGLSTTLTRIGQTRLKLGDLTGALAAYIEALEIRKDIAERSPSTVAFRDLAAAHVRVGDVHKEMESFSKSQESYQHASELFRELAASSKDVQTLKNLAITLMRMASLPTPINRNRKSYLQEAIDIWQDLLERTEDPYYRRLMTDAQVVLSTLQSQT